MQRSHRCDTATVLPSAERHADADNNYSSYFNTTPSPTTCQISFTTQFNVREKGNSSGLIIGQITQGQLYTAFFKSSPSLDGGQIWVQIQLPNSQIGWVKAADNTNNFVTSASMGCFTGLQTYRGNFPQGWDQNIARIDQNLVNQAGGVLSYLYLEGQRDPALLVARLAISESGSTIPEIPRVSYRQEIELICWELRIRAFIGLLNYNPNGTRRNLQITTQHGIQIYSFTSNGLAGSSTTIVDDIICSALGVAPGINIPSPVAGIVYQPITDVVQHGNPSMEVIPNLLAGFYPKDIFAVEDLYDAYQRAQLILAAPWNQFNTNIIGYDSWFAGLPQASSRMPHTSGKYPPLVSIRPNNQNSYYDWYDTDNYFFSECITKGLGTNSTTFPGGPFPFTQSAPGFFNSTFPATPTC